jgi:hypothetical protein
MYVHSSSAVCSTTCMHLCCVHLSVDYPDRGISVLQGSQYYSVSYQVCCVRVWDRCYIRNGVSIHHWPPSLCSCCLTALPMCTFVLAGLLPCWCLECVVMVHMCSTHVFGLREALTSHHLTAPASVQGGVGWPQPSRPHLQGLPLRLACSRPCLTLTRHTFSRHKLHTLHYDRHRRCWRGTAFF